mgnify:CR=1 FL=1
MRRRAFLASAVAALTPRMGWADVGSGTLDWRGKLAPGAIENGARWLVAEHDKPSDPARFARNSFSFLNSLQ